MTWIGIKCQFLDRAFRTPIDCQAIFTILPANIAGPSMRDHVADPVMPRQGGRLENSRI